jgi:hypothetical protein
MSGRDDKVYAEAAALWRQMRGGPPPPGADGRTVLDLLVSSLPDASYERLATVHLRPANIAFPKRAKRD